MSTRKGELNSVVLACLLQLDKVLALDPSHAKARQALSTLETVETAADNDGPRLSA